MSHKKYRVEKNCLNCGSEVFGKFCQNCGQENIETRDNFFHLVGHFISDYLHFDSKFFRSLIPLIAKPGFLTREYWEGRRVRYIPPLRLFFFVTIIFMVMTSYFYGRYGERMKEAMIRPDRALATFDSLEVANMPDSTMVTVPEWNREVTAKELEQMLASDRRQFLKANAGLDFVFRNLKYVTFFLLPVYALLFKLLYVRRKSYYIDHLIYVMHLQTFTYIVLSVLFIVPAIFPGTINSLVDIVLAITFVYVLLSLRYLYKQPWWKTVLKSAIATFMLFFVTTMVIVVITIFDAMLLQ